MLQTDPYTVCVIACDSFISCVPILPFYMPMGEADLQRVDKWKNENVLVKALDLRSS